MTMEKHKKKEKKMMIKRNNNNQIRRINKHKMNNAIVGWGFLQGPGVSCDEKKNRKEN